LKKGFWIDISKELISHIFTVKGCRADRMPIRRAMCMGTKLNASAQSSVGSLMTGIPETTRIGSMREEEVILTIFGADLGTIFRGIGAGREGFGNWFEESAERELRIGTSSSWRFCLSILPWLGGRLACLDLLFGLAESICSSPRSFTSQLKEYGWKNLITPKR